MLSLQAGQSPDSLEVHLKVMFYVTWMKTQKDGKVTEQGKRETYSVFFGFDFRAVFTRKGERVAPAEAQLLGKEPSAMEPRRVRLSIAEGGMQLQICENANK